MQHLHIDRKVAESLFRELLNEKPAYRVLNLYGTNGHGKTYFKEYLKEKYLFNSKKLIYIELDFQNRLLHKPQAAIMNIAKKLEQKYDFNFMTLWKAYAILWQKRYENSPIMYAVDLPYFREIKKIISINRGKSTIHIPKKLLGEQIAKELEELKNLDPIAIEDKLYKFFANDLRRIVKKSQYNDCVFLIDNIELLNEDKNLTPCQKDGWIRDLITNIGKDALFAIFSNSNLQWKNCNSTWSDVIKSYEISPLTDDDAIKFLEKIQNDELKKSILVSSGNIPFWLNLAKYGYKQDYIQPTVTNDIFNEFIKHLNKDILEILKIVANARFFTIDMLFTIAKQFEIDFNKRKAKELLGFEFIKEMDKNKFVIDKLFKDRLNYITTEDEEVEYKSFLFSYYENILQSLDRELIKNIPELIDEALEEAWYHLNLINSEPLVHFEWLDYYIDRFYMFAAWESFVDRYLQIMPLLEKSDDEVSKNKLVSLYNNLAGLYESLGEIKKAKEYYNKVIKLNRVELLSA